MKLMIKQQKQEENSKDMIIIIWSIFWTSKTTSRFIMPYWINCL